MARGHIRQRGKGTWAVVVSLGRDPATGERRRKWVTVRDYLATWLQDVVAVRNRQRTQEGYASIIRQYILPSIGQVQLAKLEPSHVDGMLGRMLRRGLSANTAHHAYVVLSKALKDALRKGVGGAQCLPSR